MAERRVTVRVDLIGGGNLSQVAGQAAAQAARLNQVVKGAAAQVTQVGRAAGAGLGVPQGIPLGIRMGIPVARLAPRGPTAAASQAATAGPAAGVPTAAGALAAARVTHERNFLAGLDRFRQTIEPVSRATRFGGAALLGAAYGGVASVSPEANSQITNSFRMIANEIGIAVLPSMIQLTHTLQQVARGVRTANEASDGWVGSLITYGGLALTALGSIGLAAGPIRSGASAGGAALRGMGLMGATAGTPATVGTGGEALGAVGAAALPMVARIPALYGLISTGLQDVGLARDIAQERGPAYDPEASGVSAFAQRVNQIGTAVGNVVPGVGEFTNALTSVGNRINAALGASEHEMVPTHGLTATILESIGLGRDRGAIAGEGGAATPPLDVTERNPRFFSSAEELQQSMMLRALGEPDALAAQHARANDALTAALNRTVDALEANTDAARAVSNWGPPSTADG